MKRGQRKMGASHVKPNMVRLTKLDENEQKTVYVMIPETELGDFLAQGWERF